MTVLRALHFQKGLRSQRPRATQAQHLTRRRQYLTELASSLTPSPDPPPCSLPRHTASTRAAPRSAAQQYTEPLPVRPHTQALSRISARLTAPRQIKRWRAALFRAARISPPPGCAAEPPLQLPVPACVPTCSFSCALHHPIHTSLRRGWAGPRSAASRKQT